MKVYELEGRDKIRCLKVANKVNELIRHSEELEKRIKKLEKKG